MLKMKKYCKVPFPERLSEAYELRGNRLTANVGADKMLPMLRDFIDLHENEPIFFILELPCNQKKEDELNDPENLHNDVYYIDGMSHAEAMMLLDRSGELLADSGMVTFGFGGHESQDEILFEDYNVTTLFGREPRKMCDFMESHGINEVETLVTAWDTFTQESPGTCTSAPEIYDLPEVYKGWGMYFAETR